MVFSPHHEYSNEYKEETKAKSILESNEKGREKEDTKKNFFYDEGNGELSLGNSERQRGIDKEANKKLIMRDN